VLDSRRERSCARCGAGEPAKSEAALKAVDRRLVRRDAGLIQLFDPPFDRSALNPGYIKGYIPGVRENGGQYTHAAVWTVMAFAQRGDHDRAWELFHLLNPVRHGGDAAGIAVYKVEPYVIAADVYALPPHTGRGGWSWYTGSAGWTYRMLVETLLGITLSGETLLLSPRLPRSWTAMKVHYRFRQTVYHITFRRATDRLAADGVARLDGAPLAGAAIPLRDDHREHAVELVFP
jgi:cellobiose phosphorylase